ncbi:MAG: tRNA dimethylallyltransferase [Candidatus Peribacteraceae bacterium]|nr:tRNA dimethylallyltransferase [Candidatus Peribacteraceae bacterium]
MITSHLQERLQEFMKSASQPLIVILGPTASGKTAISIDLAVMLGNTEIVNSDSRQLYKYLNIGTAKITLEEMQDVPHHLLDILDPKEEATAAWYKEEAQKVIGQIHSRGHIPMLVGGSMLYISAVTDGLTFPANRGMRKPLQERKHVKPSENLFIIGIDRPREEMMRRIDDRTAELFRKGWVEEVRELLRRGYTHEDPAMKSHGYREIMNFIQSGTPSQEKLVDSISKKTRQYAKRQMTWWRGDPRIEWLTLS